MQSRLLKGKKMKRILIVLLLASSFLLAENTEYKIIDSKTNQEIGLKGMVEKLSDYSIIFFGEFHDNKILHDLEFELLKMYYSKNKNLIISLEMFERDVQPVLDKYLSDEITEEEFVENSRPWPNYEADYKPLVEFAKENELTVIASNIPRRYAAKISKQGLNALDSLSAEEKKFVARKHNVIDDEYKKRFISVMESNMEHSEKMPMGKKINFETIYAAQCMKDDTMAESILKYHRLPPRRKVIHFNGEFHSRKHLGTAQKIQRLEPMSKVAVITPIMCDGEFSWDDDDLLEGEFLILLLDKSDEVTEE